MRNVLSEELVKAAELAVSRFFEINGARRARVEDVLQYAKGSGLHRAETKAARKNLGIVSRKEDGSYWWYWPEDTDPGVVNTQKSREVFERCGNQKSKKS